MTDGRRDQGFSVTPQRIGGDAGRPARRGRWTRRIGVALVAIAGLAIVAVGWFGPRIDQRPSLDTSFFATPVPLSTPSPRSTPSSTGIPGPTDLPRLTRPAGSTISGTLIYLDEAAMRGVDLTSGAAIEGPPTGMGRDAVIADPNDSGWTCVCFADGLVDGYALVDVRLVQIGSDLATLGSTPIGHLVGPRPSADGSQVISTDVDLSDDHRHGVLAWATRGTAGWKVTIEPLDVVGGNTGAAVELGTVAPPVPGPSVAPSAAALIDPAFVQDQYFDGPHVRVDPTGRVAFVWGTIQESRADGGTDLRAVAWRVALAADGSVGEARNAPELAATQPLCGTVGFAAADRLAWLCPHFPDATSAEVTWTVGGLDLEGRSIGEMRLADYTSCCFTDPIFDTANGVIYLWAATDLVAARIDIHRLTGEVVRFDPAAQAAPGGPAEGGTLPPVWRMPGSVSGRYGAGQIAGSADGSAIYALGFAPQVTSDRGMPPSLGVFVIDRSTLALLRRWAPAADYTGIAVLRDGLVYASGSPSVNFSGQTTPVQASVTIHRPADGAILLRVGQLGTSLPPLVIAR